jgi:hypothetical protein
MNGAFGPLSCLGFSFVDCLSAPGGAVLFSAALLPLVLSPIVYDLICHPAPLRDMLGLLPAARAAVHASWNSIGNQTGMTPVKGSYSFSNILWYAQRMRSFVFSASATMSHWSPSRSTISEIAP